ncbi:hypothetical protein ACTXT7_007477, partial [Hymenolepis weldensis]
MKLLLDHNYKFSEPDPPQTDSDDSPSALVTPEEEFETGQFHTSNREHSIELRLLLAILTLYQERSSTARMSKYQPSKRDNDKSSNSVSSGNSVHTHNSLYRTTPAQHYPAAIVRPTDSIAVKFQTLSSCSSSVSIYKNSLVNEADTIPSTPVFK